MQKDWLSLGLMSGTSGDGVDASIIKSNGIDQYELIKDEYFEYDTDIFKDIHNLKEKIHSVDHLIKFKKDLDNLERKITLFHAQVVKKLNITKDTIIGFHGQTIYHNAKEKISTQLGNGKLLNQLTNTDAVIIASISALVPFIGNIILIAFISPVRQLMQSPSAQKKLNQISSILLLIVAVMILVL